VAWPSPQRKKWPSSLCSQRWDSLIMSSKRDSMFVLDLAQLRAVARFDCVKAISASAL
jgi:hypothetical protein